MAAATRFVAVGRAVAVLLCTVLLPVGASSAVPAAMAGVVCAWQLAFTRTLLSGRRGLATVVDGGLVVAACVALPWLDPAHGHLDFDDWARRLTSMVVTAGQWWTRPRGGVLLTVAVAAAAAGGAVLAGADDWNMRTAHAVTLLWQGALSRCLVVLVARGARRVDEAATEVANGHRAAQLAAARRDDVEEHLAWLHDTVAATLTAAASPGVGGPELPDRARAELARLGAELHPVADLTTPGVTGPVRVTTALPERALEEALRKVPVEVVHALAAARDEALRNVERHARTDAARVELRLPAGGGVEVVVADDGCGFWPDEVNDSGFGLRFSIRARMRRAGGSASVESAPGSGTRVVLRWPA